MKRNDNVLIMTYNPPAKGRIMDMYTVPIEHIYEKELIQKYPKGVPMVEVMMDNGKLLMFVEDVVKKA